ncbi:reverse transcriptase family protein [Paraburkholderia sp. J12]|uniref:reverse transcriptase family protein n=1 Tax=Paraburkholderia sp. J12 TaxID=2805432 RepID=UPI002ABE77B8|nr:reverse transcriptase family protein [Paraburkholderia sp. J12]
MNTPPLLVTFPSVDFFVSALADDTRNLYETEIRRLVEAGLPPVVSLRTVAVLFGFSPSFVGTLAKRPTRYYRVFEIRTGKKVRVIQAPRVALKLIQRWIGGNLASSFSYLDSTFGFVPGRSHIDAAARHCESDWAYSIDIKDFFRTTSAAQVRAALIELGYSNHAADLMVALTCYEGFLAQGAPSSPVLSNLVFQKFDRLLEALAGELNLTFTRYADDIVFSGTGKPAELRDRVRAIIELGGWRIAEKKEKLFQKPYRLKVHGLLVDGAVPRLTKGYRRRIRALEHLLSQGKVSPKQLPVVKGHLNYARQVDDWSASQTSENEEGST